ncbi:MAG: NUDIX hydrolase [Desulfobacterales bacterium]|nr:NUDIX hydrolase [Desulfobacterales bacterium]
MNFCSNCGARVNRQIPEGDDRPRDVCLSCGQIHYENPKLVVGVIPEWRGRILLCRRAIAPREGLWTLPAGYLENGETAAEGARRETWEEARARVDELTPYALFDLTFVNQLYLMYRGALISDDCQPGEESLEVGFFSEAEIPWNAIAFKVIEETLRRYFRDCKDGGFPFQTGRIHPPVRRE